MGKNTSPFHGLKDWDEVGVIRFKSCMRLKVPLGTCLQGLLNGPT